MLGPMTDQTNHECWTLSQLRTELARFEQQLVASGKAPDTVQTYLDRPERFIKFLEGTYVP
jgi:hypothetical protein